MAMTRRETRFTNFLRSRGVGVILSVLAVWMSWRELPAGVRDFSGGDFQPLVSWGANTLLLLGVAGILASLNRTYNLLRTISVFFVSFFLFITFSVPRIASGLTVGTPLALAVVLCTWILFSLYNVRMSDRRIFLIFTILSCGTLSDWHFAFYIPVFLVGLGQMRIFRFKKVVAAIIGLVTPVWIVWGLDLMPLPRLPHIFFTPPSILMEMPDSWPLLCTAALTMVTGFLTGCVNLLRILGFNARSRSYNGFIAMLGIVTGVFAIVNFTALPVYLPLLNACVALQVGHFFRLTASRRGYIAVLLLLAAYTTLYIWQT